MRNPVKKKAYILGAGVSGLVSAWRLLQRGWDVEIFEKESAWGGMSRTWKWRDFLVDVGPHLFHTPDPAMADFWEKEFGDLFVKGEFYCCNVKGSDFSEYYPYPLSYEGLGKLPADLRKLILKELEEINPEARARATSYGEYVRALVGPTLQGMFYEKYPQKVWGLRTDEMTPLWAPKRIELRQKITPFYVGQWNAVGKYGTGCIYDRIQQHIVKLGGKIHLGKPITGMRRSGQTLTALECAGGETIALAPSDVVVSTLPINLTAQLLDTPTSLSFRGIISVYLAFKKETIIPEGLHWLYFDSEKLIFNRISEQKKMAPETAVPGKTCMTLEIAYTRGDALDQMPEEALIQKALDDFLKTKLARREDYEAGSLHKQPAVYPLLYKDYQHELVRVQNKLGEYRQLYFIGTTGEFSYADSQILFQKAFDLVDVLTDAHSESSQVKRMPVAATLHTDVALGEKIVGNGHRPYIIAEAGLNHNGSLPMALQLIDQAVAAGCDAIKFQTYKSASRVSGEVKKVRYAETIIGTEETLLEMFQRLELSKEDHVKLFAYARSKGIAIFSTPFDFESVELLESVNTPFYKLASFDLVNIPLLRAVARTQKPVILSTGMSTLGQIEQALDTIRSEGNPNAILLHCVSSYPASPESMNLKVIETLKRAFRVPVGLSDHTLGLMVSQFALALGANIIERHFTLDRTLEGPDHILSSEPAEMRQLVRSAALVTNVLGDGIKRIAPSEYDTINSQRKSLYAKTPIKQGQVIDEKAIAIKGPGGGLQPMYFDIVKGRTARRDIRADHPITWDDI